MIGNVVFFSDEKGWGFIRADDKDYFFHWTDILEKANRKLYAGDRVTFDACTTIKGLSAANVRRYERHCS